MRRKLTSANIMVQALTIISALHLISEAKEPAMVKCNNDRGVLRFERMPDVKLNGLTGSESHRSTKFPGEVLYDCQNWCLQDVLGEGGVSFPCGSVDFVPGQRFSSYSPSLETTESKCFYNMENSRPGVSPEFQSLENYYYFREVCYSGPKINSRAEMPAVVKDCPKRLYVMERFMKKRFFHSESRLIRGVSTLEECEEICLNQAADDPIMATSVCRAGTFDHKNSMCYLSYFTRRTHSHEFVDHPDFDYFENTCLRIEQRCPKEKIFWTKEENAKMVGPYDVQGFRNISFEECKARCLLNEAIFCRSLEYDLLTKTCILSDEDSISRPGKVKPTGAESSLESVYLELTCIDGSKVSPPSLLDVGRGRETQLLSERNFNDVKTAFQLFRNRAMELSPGFVQNGREGTRVTLAECLDACLEEKEFQCRSVTYSERLQSCLLSEHDRINGNLVYDPDKHYFENLMRSDRDRTLGGGTLGPGSRFGGSSFDRGDSSFSAGGGFSRTQGDFSRFHTSGDWIGAGGNQRTGSFGSSDSSSGRFADGGRGPSDFKGSRQGTFINPFLGNRNTFDGGDSNIRGSETNLGDSRFSGNRFDSGSGFWENRRGLGGQPGFGGSFRGTSGSTETRGQTNLGGSGFDHLVGTLADLRRMQAQGGGGISSQGSTFVGRFGQTGVGDSSFLDNRLGDSRFGSFDPSSRPGFGLSSTNQFGDGALSGFGGGRGSAAGFTGFGGSSEFSPATSLSLSDLSKGIEGVSQQCSPDGSMEFLLRTTEPFRGRIYAYGYYDTCFYRGGGSLVNTLRLSPPRALPECGTKQYGDTTTNIIVVQFADNVMTSFDKRYNLTCTTIGPGDTVVTSGYIGAGLGVPTPIEYLPEESRLDARVRLQILYGGRSTTTVAVGDPLTFRIESLLGRGLLHDIFATDVVVRDPMSGRAIQLIDSRGCPINTFVFPALGKDRSGDGLETRFNAFKIPEANVMIFEARVRMCRDECPPVLCQTGIGREEVLSYGKRRRREATEPDELQSQDQINNTFQEKKFPEEEEQDEREEETSVQQILEVYMNRDDIPDAEAEPLVDSVCVAPSEYYSLVAGIFLTTAMLVASLVTLGFCFFKSRNILAKNAAADASNPRQSFPGSHARTLSQPARYFPSSQGFDIPGPSSSSERKFTDPSEPIYTDPTLFEKSYTPSKKSDSSNL